MSEPTTIDTNKALRTAGVAFVSLIGLNWLLDKIGIGEGMFGSFVALLGSIGIAGLYHQKADAAVMEAVDSTTDRISDAMEIEPPAVPRAPAAAPSRAH